MVIVFNGVALRIGTVKALGLCSGSQALVCQRWGWLAEVSRLIDVPLAGGGNPSVMYGAVEQQRWAMTPPRLPPH